MHPSTIKAWRFEEISRPMDSQIAGDMDYNHSQSGWYEHEATGLGAMHPFVSQMHLLLVNHTFLSISCSHAVFMIPEEKKLRA